MTSPSPAPVRLDRAVPFVAELVLDRPKAFNALNIAVTDLMTAHLAACAADDDIRVVILRAEGAHFAAGADVREMAAMSGAEARERDFAGCCTALGGFPKPVVAAVQGLALGGGCELIEMCDIVIAAEDAAFGHPEILLGTMPGAGGTQRLPRLVGMAAALDMLLTGRRIDAATALHLGLVSRVVPAAELLAEARKAAAAVAALPPRVTVLMKATARAAAEVPLSEGLALERAGFHRTLDLPERTEGMAAFLEKRPADFSRSPA
ncbi:enoyl-CoA hydratase-related protein [Zavarzinia compransoris]|uniref:enoyl-CoA hydratase/isomerase family protein n=1 Tax=Zavarzinia marina TaxID=2911065 RepID=UPI001F275C34|nr:enoyl-CoA hydratase-related protein [Zavarzinia marina]MCF4164352.1 enoyl-CoA hydratase-related protein [Zavarzinia marina]